MSETLLRVHSLSKIYSNLTVLEDINFELQRGEILGLVGRRGTGKSTLLHLLGGHTQPSRGTISFQGRPVHFTSPHQARREGIELVNQFAQLVVHLDVIQNIFLGHEITRLPSIGLPKWEQMVEIAGGLLAKFDLPHYLINKPVASLTNEQRNLIALMRAFCMPARLLLLDDVLPNLGYHRQKVVLERVREQARQGLGVIICSDNLKHLFSITDRILVLYEGRLVADRNTSDFTPRDVVELIVGVSHQEQVTPVIWALESYHAAEKQTEELFRRQTELHESLEASDSLNRELVEKLSDQVEALNRLNAALQETQRRLLTEREEERKALARELHDLVIQDLLSVNYRLEESESDTIPQEHSAELKAIRSGIRNVVGDLRQLCRDLRPPTIDNHGLPAAIRSHMQEWGDRTGIVIKVDIDPSLGRLPETTEISVFRIIQEGLNNIAKHARAANVSLMMRRTPTDNLLVRLVDDGRGFHIPPNLADLSKKKHFGLIGISERAALLGGRMQLTSLVEGGSVLEVEIPSPYPSV